MIDKKNMYVNIAIGIITFILSWVTGAVIGTVILCGGTIWLYIRTHKFWKYILITLIGDAIMAIAAGISLFAGFGLDSYEINNELDKLGFLFAFPGAIVLSILLAIAFLIFAVIRFGLQCLFSYITKKIIEKKDKKLTDGIFDDIEL